MRNLNTDYGIVESFINATNHLAKKKGCLLIQFPGSITSDYRLNVEKIISNIYNADNENKWRKAVEFRDSTWYTDRTRKFLHLYRATLVLQDMPKSKNLEVDKMAGFYYFRFHGPTGDYKGCYTDEFLEEQAKKIRILLVQKKDVYVYFNNTMGEAFKNAITLREKVAKLNC